MKLPPDSLIPIEKITRYLLVPLVRGDKLAFPVSALEALREDEVLCARVM